MAHVKRYLTRVDIARLLNLEPADVAHLLAREPLLKLTKVGGRAVVPVRLWRAWVQNMNERALAKLEGDR